ncbi:MAG: 50S ribosomal protein L24 [Candidatus Pacebacteria bacterium]|jgi:large subunit ribosomal protein L24|nr:50S ribosomal protein L24 [Candidatus Paceibacterota bacterium]
MQKIKKGDTVLVVKGKDKGKKGKVIKVIPKEARIIVEGVNLVKKHLKPKRVGEKGKIVEIPAPLSWANVRLICPSCSKPTKVGFRFEGEKKVRYCKKCNKSF